MNVRTICFNRLHMTNKSSGKRPKAAGKSTEYQAESDKKGSIFSSPVLHAAVIVIAAFLIYSNTFHNFFNFDDLNNIVDNSTIKNIDNFWPPAGTRYIGSLTFAINYRLGGLDPFGYHIVNLAIHMFNALLVYWLVALTLITPYMIRSKRNNQYLIAFLCSMLFVSHPMQTEAVTYLVQRFASLATLFYLMTLVAYIKFRQGSESQNRVIKSIVSDIPRGLATGSAGEYNEKNVPCSETPRGLVAGGLQSGLWYLAALTSAIFAMYTKEIAFTLPVVMLIYELMFFEGSTRKRILFLIPFVLTMLIIPLTLIGGTAVSLTEIKGIDEVAGKMSDTQDIPRMHYLYTQFRVIVTYIRLLFLPVMQNLDYDYPVYTSFFNAEVFMSFVFLLLVPVMGIYLYRKLQSSDSEGRDVLRLGFFGLLWFFVTLSVESSIIPIRDVIFEHRVYLPSVGFFMVLTAASKMAWTRFRGGYSRKALVYITVFLVVVLSVATYKRNAVWKDEVSLWEDTLKGSPNKSRPHNNLGTAYANQGHIDEAINEYKTALKIKPDFAGAHYNLGTAYGKRGRIDEAIKEFQEALKNNPDYAEAHNNLGTAYSQQGRLDEASNEYKTALKIKPDYVDAHKNLGNVYEEQGRLDEAINEFKAALKINPYYVDAYNNLGSAYLMQGHYNEAINEYQTALKINPYYIDAHINLGTAYAKQGRLDEAKKEFQKVLKIKPDYADSHNKLGTDYAEQGRLDEAINEYKTALKIKPGYANTHNNLGTAYAKQGHIDEAINEYKIALKIKPDYADAHYNIGTAYSKKGRLDEAINEYKTALKIKPDFAGAHFNLGTAYSKQGRIDEAIKEFQEVLKINPENTRARKNLESLTDRMKR